MNNVATWSLLVGAFLPPVMAFLIQSGWSDAVKAVVSVLVCIVVGFITTWLAGDFKFGDELVTSILLVLVAALTTYRNFWKKTGIAPAIETRTNFVK